MAPLSAILAMCLIVGLASADERQKRQVYGGQPAGYRPNDSYQPQPQRQQLYGHQPEAQYAPQQQAQRPQRPHRQYAEPEEDKEEDHGPHPLTLLLENSKFECGSKSDGYYADSDVGCQAFHYCVSGQKHSMMCPEGTVFHQVHLNCVPRDQDICNKADKFFFVNDYLNKPLTEKGPNNTIVYAQRYYPDNYANGDPFIPPQDGNRREPPAATYGLGPAYREQQPAPVQQQPPQPHRQQYHQPQVAPQPHRQQQQHQPQVVRQQPAPPAYARPQPAPVAHRPQPAPYAPPQAYQPRPQAYQPAPQAYQPAPQQVRPALVQQPQPQVQLYGYGAEQAHLAQAQQAQRAYAHQQHEAVAPQQHLYAPGQRPRYAQPY